MKYQVPFTWGLERRWGMRFVHDAREGKQFGDWERREGSWRSEPKSLGGGGFGHVAESLSGYTGAKHEKSNIPVCDETDGCG